MSVQIKLWSDADVVCLQMSGFPESEDVSRWLALFLDRLRSGVLVRNLALRCTHPDADSMRTILPEMEIDSPQANGACSDPHANVIIHMALDSNRWLLRLHGSIPPSSIGDALFHYCFYYAAYYPYVNLHLDLDGLDSTSRDRVVSICASNRQEYAALTWSPAKS